jgi:hypothetical protein
MFDQFVSYLTQFFGFLDIREPAAAYGAIFGLVGFALQLLVRGEWPTGRLNDGSPKIVDPTAAAWSLLMAIAIGMAAAKFFRLDVRMNETEAFIAAAPPKVFSEINSDVRNCIADLSNPTECTPLLQGQVAKALILIALAYVAADAKIMVDKLQQFFQSIGKLLAAIPNRLGITR